MSFLFFLLFLVIGIAVVILLVVFGFLRTIFGFGKRRNSFPGEENHEERTSRNPFKSPEQKPKVFDKQEGEYVDYEDVKD
jgi:hypothetical protein